MKYDIDYAYDVLKAFSKTKVEMYRNVIFPKHVGRSFIWRVWGDFLYLQCKPQQRKSSDIIWLLARLAALFI